MVSVLRGRAFALHHAVHCQARVRRYVLLFLECPINNGLLDRCAYATLTAVMAAVVASGQLEKQTLEEATLRRTFHYRYVTHTRFCCSSCGCEWYEYSHVGWVSLAGSTRPPSRRG